jgi:putative membrane protein
MSALQWLTPWEPSFPIATALALTAVLFIQGRLKVKPAFFRQLSFWVGFLSIYAVTQTQFDYYAEHEFFIHQIQNLVLHHWGPFLIILSCSNGILFAGLPELTKQSIRKFVTLRPIVSLIKLFSQPAVEVIIFVGLTIFWLLPSIHFITMLDWRLYRLMNWTMLLNGLMFWGIALDLHTGLSAGRRIAMMLAIIPPQIVVGVLLFISMHEIYPIYSLCGRALSTVNAISDQHIGGLILWTQGMMMSILGILMVIHKELKPKDNVRKW